MSAEITESLHRITLRAVAKAVRQGLEGLRAEPPLPLSEWAASHFVMSEESSHQTGEWVAWAFQIGMMDFMSDDRIEDLFIKKSKRLGYTKILTAFVAYNIAHRRRKQALWQPTDDDRDSYVKSEIEPVLDDVDAVKALRKTGARDSDTIKMKRFRGSVSHFLGGKAKRAFRRITVDVSMLDEWSAFDQVIEKAGDPGGLAKGRTEGAAYPKFIGGSTCGIKGMCHVTRACDEAEEVVRYHVECPHCGLDHPLQWGGKDKPWGFRWERGRPETVRHHCPHCFEPMTQAQYLPGGVPLTGAWVGVKSGRRYGPDRVWRDTAGMPCRPPKTLGVEVWAAYSPQRAWTDIVEEFEKAVRALETGDSGPMQLFVNETLGQAWELVGDRSDEHELQKRADDYPLNTVPAGALVLTAGVDVQRNRWEINVWGWGRGLESWLVADHVIEGNPANEQDWEAVTQYLHSRFPQAWRSGGSLGISAISIDSSDQTQAVYNWVRKTAGQFPALRAIKGSSEDHKPILMPATSQDVDYGGHKWPKGIQLWGTGVDTAKDLLLGQLAIEIPGPGYVHTSKQLPREWYEQLTAEQRILVKIQGRDSYKWVKRRPRNEKLDCRNYALHAAYSLRLHTMTDAQWARMEAAVQPPPDLFDLAEPPVMTSTSVHAPLPAAAPPPAAPAAPPFRPARQPQRTGAFQRDW